MELRVEVTKDLFQEEATLAFLCFFSFIFIEDVCALDVSLQKTD